MKLFNSIAKTMILTTLILSTTVSVFASTKDSSTVTLTLKEAVSRGISSCDIKTVYGSYLDAYEEINKYNKDYFSPEYRQSVLQEKVYKYNMHYISEKIAYDITTTYLDVVLLNKQIEMANNNVAISEKKLKAMAISKEKGQTSELDYKNAENQLKQLKASLISYQKELDNRVLAFKDLTHMDISKYILDTEFALEPVAIEGQPEAYFDVQLQDFYALKQDEINIRELGMQGLFETTVGKYMLQEAQLVEGKYTLDDLKNSMSTTLLQYYNNLTGYKNDIDTCELKIQASKEQLKATEIKYNNGYISKLEYQEALLKQQELQVEKFGKIKLYLTTKMMLEKPNILTMK